MWTPYIYVSKDVRMCHFSNHDGSVSKSLGNTAVDQIINITHTLDQFFLSREWFLRKKWHSHILQNTGSSQYSQESFFPHSEPDETCPFPIILFI